MGRARGIVHGVLGQPLRPARKRISPLPPLPIPVVKTMTYPERVDEWSSSWRVRIPDDGPESAQGRIEYFEDFRKAGWSIGVEMHPLKRVADDALTYRFDRLSDKADEDAKGEIIADVMRVNHVLSYEDIAAALEVGTGDHVGSAAEFVARFGDYGRRERDPRVANYANESQLAIDLQRIQEDAISGRLTDPGQIRGARRLARALAAPASVQIWRNDHPLYSDPSFLRAFHRNLVLRHLSGNGKPVSGLEMEPVLQQSFNDAGIPCFSSDTGSEGFDLQVGLNGQPVCVSVKTKVDGKDVTDGDGKPIELSSIVRHRGKDAQGAPGSAKKMRAKIEQLIWHMKDYPEILYVRAGYGKFPSGADYPGDDGIAYEMNRIPASYVIELLEQELQTKTLRPGLLKRNSLNIPLPPPPNPPVEFTIVLGSNESGIAVRDKRASAHELHARITCDVIGDAVRKTTGKRDSNEKPR